MIGLEDLEFLGIEPFDKEVKYCGIDMEGTGFQFSTKFFDLCGHKTRMLAQKCYG
jgi:hypothetical protein